ncbi:HEPN domain-containing protein [Saccharothrix sp. HUAS TT1]|uniref:ApeA N-terminal domain 1-containing protein n=1 Tax=unclassified Saccharothrix TaxID=2593673 RepID=UPI00345B99BF
MSQLDVNQPFDLFGQFWKAGEEEKRTPGRLYRTADGIRIQLFEDLRPGPSYVAVKQDEQNSVFEVIDSPEKHEPLTLYGRVGQMVGSITAYDCITVHSQSDLFDSGVGEYILAPRGVIFGAHTLGVKQTYSGVRVRTRDVDEWANLPGFFSSEADDGTRSLSYRMPKFEPVALTGGASFTVSQTARLTWPTVRGGSMMREVWLQVTDLQLSNWQEIDRRIVTPLSSLITLCVGEVNDLTSIELTIDGRDWFPLVSNYINYVEPRSERLRVLAGLSDLGFAGVANWLNKVETLGPLPPVIAHFSARRDVVKLETELLEMTTVAEGLHRRLRPDQKRISDEDRRQARKLVLEALKDMEDVKDVLRGVFNHIGELSYPNRLRGLADIIHDVAPEICGDQNKWSKVVSDARNSYAHRSAGFLDESNIDSLFTVVESLRWLLRCILLLEAGLDGALLGERLRDVSGFRLFLERAAENLPAIYGP